MVGATINALKHVIDKKIKTKTDLHTKITTMSTKLENRTSNTNLLKKNRQLRLDKADLKRELQQMKKKLNSLLKQNVDVSDNRFNILNMETDTVNNPVNEAEPIPGTTINNDDDWIQVLRKRNKNRKNLPLDENVETTTTSDSNTAFSNNNKQNFNSQKKVNNSPQMKKPKNAPPIKINDKDINAIKKLLKDQLKIDNFLIKSMSKFRHVLYLQTDVQHKTVCDALKSAEVECYTYTPKQEKPTNYVLKGLHGDYESEEIFNFLRNLNVENVLINKVIRLTTKKSTLENKKLPFFIVQVGPQSEINNLLKLKSIDNQIIKWEKLKKSPIIQCTRCQRFNHSAFNCNMTPRCVKCGKDHTASNCNLIKNGPAENLFCILCKSAGHPASYKQCPVYKQKFEIMTSNKQMSKQKQLNKISQVSNFINPKISYSSAVLGNATNNSNPFSNNYDTNITNNNYVNTDLSVDMNNNLGRMMNLLSELNKNVTLLCQGHKELENKLSTQAERIDFLFETLHG